MKKVIVILFIGAMYCAKGQDIEKQSTKPLLTSIGENEGGSDDGLGYFPGFEHKMAVTVFAGSQGFGGDFRYGFLPRLSARIGGAFIPVNVPNAFSVNSFQSQINLNVSFVNAHIIADFQPFVSSGFRLAFGLGYFVKGSTTGNFTPEQGIKYGNIVLTAQQLGNVQITANWAGAAPYLGLGFIRTFPKDLFNINIDFGTYYLAAPQTTIIATGALAGNEANNEQLQQNLSNYRWLPVLQVNFNFKL